MAPPTLRRPSVLNASQIVLASFALFVMLGAFLLSIPVCHQGEPHRFVDDLFTSASAVCVTGLATLDPATRYSRLGQTLIMLLIQIGGLGYMSLFTLSMVLIGQRLSLRDRLNLRDATEQPGLGGIVPFIVNILRLTFAIELAGVVLLALHTVPELGWSEGLYMALFHSVSAFNNAGFSLFSDNIVHWQHAHWPLVVLSGLTILGGLGFNVNQELLRRLSRRSAHARWSVLVSLVLRMTALLLVGGTVVFWLIERGNPGTIRDLPLAEQWVNAFFMAVQPRTSGFNSVPMGALQVPSLMLMMVFMFIGTGPGGTGGGIKLTTFAVVSAVVMTAVRGGDDVNLFGYRRRIGERLARKAVAVTVLSAVFVALVAMALATLEPQPLLAVLVETFSAFGTVGLSVGITPQLGDPAKLLLVLTMLIGRVGLLTLMLSLFPGRRKSAVRYAEEPLLVG